MRELSKSFRVFLRRPDYYAQDEIDTHKYFYTEQSPKTQIRKRKKQELPQRHWPQSREQNRHNHWP